MDQKKYIKDSVDASSTRGDATLVWWWEKEMNSMNLRKLLPTTQAHSSINDIIDYKSQSNIKNIITP